MLPVALLLVFTVMAAAGMGYTLCYYDPYLPLFFLSFTLPYTAITIVFLLLGLVVSRPFCRFFCPYSVLLRFFALFAAKQPQITVNSCINCKLCEQGCPNRAIIPPEVTPPPNVQKHGARRLATLVSLTPFALLLGGVIGYIAAPVVSEYHPDVRLLRMLNAGEQTLEVEAFEVSETSPEELANNAAHAQNRILHGMCLAGMVFAGCVMAELIAESRRRKEEDTYCIDSSLCFCCARCYQTCPLETCTERGITNAGAKF
jgi:ferredoxin